MAAAPSEAKPARPPSKFKLQGGTGDQVSNPSLIDALDRLKRGIRGVRATGSACSTGRQVVASRNGECRAARGQARAIGGDTKITRFYGANERLNQGEWI